MVKVSSALKRQKQNLKRRGRNQAVKSAVRTIFKKASLAVAEHSPDAEAEVKKAFSIADRAAAKRIIHPNKAARKKSRLMKKLSAKA